MRKEVGIAQCKDRHAGAALPESQRQHATVSPEEAPRALIAATPTKNVDSV